MLFKLRNLFRKSRQLSDEERIALFIAMNRRLQQRLQGLPVESIEEMVQKILRQEQPC